MKKWKERYLGDKKFYRHVLALAIPMILQNVVTNFVSMLDNIMVGQVGTAQMNGVSVVNQYMFIFNITVFGAISGPGIFGAQFYGKGDHEGQRSTFQFRLLLSVLIVGIFMVLFSCFDSPLISLYLAKDDLPKLREMTLMYGREYMRIMLFTLIPFAIGQTYASVERECGNTMIPMFGSVAAVAVNLVLDYGLIFGRLGMPQLGVTGAAIATFAAKTVEALVVIVWAHAKPEQNRYIVGAFTKWKIKKSLIWDMIVKGTPLLINEFLWVIGMSFVAQLYSVRGLDVVAARNISGVIVNLFGVIYLQLGMCIAIIVGAKLGAGDHKGAISDARKLRVFALMVSAVTGILTLPFVKWFPSIYNTEPEVRSLSSFMILVQALVMPIWCYTNACYFTLRSGGKTGITFLFDFVFTWIVMIPLAFVLVHLTNMEIHLLYFIVTFSEIVKVIVGYFMVKSELWVKTIVS